MLGKTHFSFGLAASIIYGHPTSLTSYAIGLSVGALGSIIPDIDIGTSKSHKELLKIIAVLLFIIGMTVLSDVYFNVGIYETITKNRNGVIISIALISFAFVSIIGMLSAHRGFMHSFFALLLLSSCVYCIYQPVLPYFVVGFLSHLFLDIFNEKKVQLFYPLKNLGISLGIASSDGKLNWLFFLIGVGFFTWGTIHSLFHILGLISIDL
ncbi:MAG: metal-dependent hydrolase [Succinivibrionaceae bacterium]